MVGIHIAGILAIAACLVLAQWQWSRAHVETTGEVSTVTGSLDELNPLRQFMPVASIGATTTVEGRWVPGSRIELGDRIPDGEQLSRAAGKDHNQTVIVDWAIPVCTWISDALELADLVTSSRFGICRGADGHQRGRQLHRTHTRKLLA